ncbi:MAG: hypothetical protein HYU76_14335 [Betaproteobacteria bacterium]|nr:hypothetical protein [Betaproteobacteria bacterium]
MPPRIKKAGAAAVFFVLLLGACAETEPKGRHVNLSGFSPAFQQGYAEGCGSASSRSVRRDESRYKTDFDYMQGLNDGFSICAKRK